MDLFIYVCDGCHEVVFLTKRINDEKPESDIRRHTCNAGKLVYQGATTVYLQLETPEPE